MTTPRDPSGTGPAWRRYLRFIRPDVPADVDDELAFHIQMRIERNRSLGMSNEEARREALARFGRLGDVRSALVAHDQHKHDTARRREYVSDFIRDLKFGARSLRRSPGFTLAATLTLALGIGANAAIFSIVNAVVLRPLPYAHPDRLVSLGWGSPGELLALRDRLRSVSSLAAWTLRTHPIDVGGNAVRAKGAAVTPDLLPLLGVTPMIGRTFTDRDAVVGASPVVIVSYGLWQRELGGAHDVIGRTLTIEGSLSTVVGVMPPTFAFPNKTIEYWQPDVLDPTNAVAMWADQYVEIVGALASGATLTQAQYEVRTVWPTLRRLNPIWDPGPKYRQDATITPLQQDIVGAARPLLWMLFGSVVLVLLIGCVNVANLLLARATARERELSVRAALGGGRGRLIRQLVTESVLLSGVGAGLGIALGVLAVRWLVAVMPPGVPRTDEIAMSGPVLAYTAVVSLATGVLFGIVPALRATSGTRGAPALAGAGRTTFGVSHAGTSAMLVAGEVALAVLLVVASLLLVRSFVALRAVQPGFETTHVVAARITLPKARYVDGGQATSFCEAVVARTTALPGVRSAAAVDMLPIAELVWGAAMRIQGQFEDVKHNLPMVDHRQTVTPAYFATMEIPILRGRGFTDDDREGQPLVAIVSQSFARHYWPGAEAIGKRIGYPWESPWITIVGVVPDVRADSLRDTTAQSLYIPWRQHVSKPPVTEMWIVARAAGDPAAVGPSIRRIVHDIDRTVAVSDVRSMGAVISESVTKERFVMLLVAAFALLALTLGAVGIYGVMSYLVSQRTREVGIRMALGASGSAVIRLVVGRGVRLAFIGSVVGIAGALLATRSLRQWLYGVSATDPVTFVAVPLLFLAVATAASYLPALRATRVDPAMTLRDT